MKTQKLTHKKHLFLLIWTVLLFSLIFTPLAMADQPTDVIAQEKEGTDDVTNQVIVSNDGLMFSADEFLQSNDYQPTFIEDDFKGKNNSGDPKLFLEENPPDIYGNGEDGRSVIYPDGRYRIYGTTYYPYRAVVHVRITWSNGSTGGCTGWLNGPRTVVTAGHCVYSHSRGGWASSITVYPGRNGSSIPYGSGTAHRLFSVVGWVSNQSKNYDYGAIQLNQTLGYTVGWFGYRAQSSNTFSGSYRVTGYPGDKPYATMWTMAENPGIKRVWSRRLFYSIDTYSGQSGAPVYHAYSSSCNPCSVAIHTNGVGGDPYYQYNSGTRITSDVFNNLYSWKYYPYP